LAIEREGKRRRRRRRRRGRRKGGREEGRKGGRKCLGLGWRGGASGWLQGKGRRSWEGGR
jgi:hypothetical protein